MSRNRNPGTASRSVARVDRDHHVGQSLDGNGDHERAVRRQRAEIADERRKAETRMAGQLKLAILGRQQTVVGNGQVHGHAVPVMFARSLPGGQSSRPGWARSPEIGPE